MHLGIPSPNGNVENESKLNSNLYKHSAISFNDRANLNQNCKTKKHQFYKHQEVREEYFQIESIKTKSVPNSPMKQLRSPRQAQRHEYGTSPRSHARRVMCRHYQSSENLWVSGRRGSHNSRVSKKYICRF